MAITQFMHSGQLNAPQVTNIAGQLLQVLDACLISGFNPQTAVTVEYLNDYINIIFGVTHGYAVYQYIEISGADDPNLNGIKRIISKTETSIQIEVGTVKTLTGVITTKIKPLGWESIFGSLDSKKRAYRSKNIKGTRTVVYLDATIYGTGYNTTDPLCKLKVDLCRDMEVLGTQIESYTKDENSKYVDGLFQFMQSSSISKAYQSSSSKRNWVIFGNEDIVYLAIDWNTNAGNLTRKVIYCFGDTPKINQNDLYNFIFSCTAWDTNGDTNSKNTNDANSSAITALFNAPSYINGYFIKDVTGLANLDKFTLTSNLGAGTSYSGFGGNANPNPLTYGLSFSDITIVTQNRKISRGTLPLLKVIQEDLSQTSLDLKIIDNYLLLSVTGNVIHNTSNNINYIAVDLGA